MSSGSFSFLPTAKFEHSKAKRKKRKIVKESLVLIAMVQLGRSIIIMCVSWNNSSVFVHCFIHEEKERVYGKNMQGDMC